MKKNQPASITSENTMQAGLNLMLSSR